MKSEILYSKVINSIERVPSPWAVFFMVYIFLYFFPSLILSYDLKTGHLLPDYIYSQVSGYVFSDADLYYYRLASFIFLFGTLFPWLCLQLFKRTNNSDKKNRIKLITDMDFESSITIRFFEYLIFLAAIACIAIFVVYFIVLGIPFLSSIGSDISSEDFRFMLFADENRNMNYLLEIARRVLLPLVVSYYFFSCFIQKGKLGFRELSLWFLLLFSGLVTLDRGPVLLALALLAVYAYYSAANVSQSIFRGFIFLCLIIFAGGLVTMVQYNNLDIDIYILVQQGLSVLVNRIIFDPSLMSLTFSFSEINGNIDPLLLEYSRLSVLWGGNYVGTFDANSKFVAPVGIVGDIWRNFGTVGILYVSTLFSSLLLLLSGMQRSVNIYMRFPIFFLTVVLSFYLIVGSLFSIGPIVLILLITLVTLISNFDTTRV